MSVPKCCMGVSARTVWSQCVLRVCVRSHTKYVYTYTVKYIRDIHIYTRRYLGIRVEDIT